MPGCHSGCCRPRQGTSAGTSSVGCGLQVPVYLWPTASCRLRRLGYLLAAADAASLQVRISPGQERSRTWSENGNAGVSFTPPSKVKEMHVLPCRPRWRRQSRVVFSGNGGGVVMVPGTYPGDLVSSSPKKRIGWAQPPTTRLQMPPVRLWEKGKCRECEERGISKHVRAYVGAFVAGEQI